MTLVYTTDAMNPDGAISGIEIHDERNCMAIQFIGRAIFMGVAILEPSAALELGKALIVAAQKQLDAPHRGAEGG